MALKLRILYTEQCKERGYMECPECGETLKHASRCGNCGKDFSHTRNGIEVEYKEFPVSELLEIRQRPYPGHQHRKRASDEHTAATGSGKTKRTPYLKVKKILVYGIVIMCVVLMVMLGFLLLQGISQ